MSKCIICGDVTLLRARPARVICTHCGNHMISSSPSTYRKSGGGRAAFGLALGSGRECERRGALGLRTQDIRQRDVANIIVILHD